MQLAVPSPAPDAHRLHGTYRHHGEHNGKVMYQKVDGDATIYSDERWKIGVRGLLVQNLVLAP